MYRKKFSLWRKNYLRNDNMDNKMPVFVKISDYKEVLDTVNELKVKLQNAKSILAQITELKHQEDAELVSWTSGLDDVEQKIMAFDNSLFQPK